MVGPFHVFDRGPHHLDSRLSFERFYENLPPIAAPEFCHRRGGWSEDYERAWATH